MPPQYAEEVVSRVESGPNSELSSDVSRPKIEINLNQAFPLGERAEMLIEVRQPVIDALAEEISSNDVLFVGTACRTGNSSVVAYLERHLTDDGRTRVLTVTGEQTRREDWERKYQKAIEGMTGDMNLIIQIEESGALVDRPKWLEWVPEFINKIRQERDTKLVFYGTDATIPDQPPTEDVMAKWIAEHVSGVTELEVVRTKLETMDRAALSRLFGIYEEAGLIPDELKRRKEDVLDYVWGPMQLNQVVRQYGDYRRHHPDTPEEAAWVWARVSFLAETGFSPEDDAIRKTGGAQLEKLLSIVGKSEEGVKIDSLNEEQKALVDRYRKFHFFKEMDGMIQVGARVLYDVVTHDTQVYEDRMDELKAPYL